MVIGFINPENRKRKADEAHYGQQKGHFKSWVGNYFVHSCDVYGKTNDRLIEI